MAGRIPQDFINDLLERVDVAEVVGARLDLKKAGREYKGLCPFHDEKTPSFHVVPDKGFYHCFGCGAHGTALTFLLEHDRMAFVDAVAQLASLAGVEVPREAAPAPRDQRRSRLLDVVARADRWFQSQLREHEGRQRVVDYLRGRGLDGYTARRFGIGYAPPGRELLEALGQDREQRELLLEAGLIGQGEDGRHYDRFRNRVIFPIRDGRGRTLAFGGRILGDGQPKYLNSPETPLFHKGRELYGLWECRQAVRDPERVLLVEGYMDVVGLAQAGVPEACASLGTAATGEQLEKLFRLAPEVVLCFDGDAAGLRAAWKAAGSALDYLTDGRAVRLLFLPAGEDPDSLVRSEGADAFRARIRDAMPLSEYLFRELAVDLDLATLDDRSRLAHRARPLLERIPGALVKGLMMQRLAELARMPVADLERIFVAARASAPQRSGAGAAVLPAGGIARTVPDPGARAPESRPADNRWDPMPPDLYGDGPLPRSQDDAVPADRHGAPGRDGRPSSPSPAARARRVRLSRAEVATALLLQRPDLAERVDESMAARLADSHANDLRLLGELLQRLHGTPDLPLAVLLTAYLGRPEHDRLRQLAAGRALPAGQLARGESASRQFGEILQLLLQERDAGRRRQLMERIRNREATDAEFREYEQLKRRAAGVPGATRNAGDHGDPS